MARIDLKEYEEYQKKIEEIYEDTDAVLKAAVYEGAKVIADEIKSQIKALPIDDRIGTPEHPLQGVTKRQKADLINGFGLAPIKKKGDYINTKAGMDGYGTVPTKKYPNGVPNQLLMRSVESGTTFRKKHPIFRPAVRKAKAAAVDAMKKRIDKEIEKRME